MKDILSSKAATFLEPDSTLMHRIAAIHVAYHSCESQILWCIQLMHSLPGLADALVKECGTSNGGLVNILAVLLDSAGYHLYICIISWYTACKSVKTASMFLLLLFPVCLFCLFVCFYHTTSGKESNTG